MVVTIPFLFLLDTTEAIEICFFGIHLSKSETALTEFVTCNGSEMKIFSTIEEDIQEIIVARSCVKDLDDSVIICANHEDLLGKHFLQKTHTLNRNCLWPSHQKIRSSVKDLRNPFPSTLGDDRKQSMFLFSNHSVLLPFQSKVCKMCKPKCAKMLEGFIEESIRSPVIRRSVLAFENLPDISPRSNSASLASSQDTFNVASQASSHDCYSMPSQDKQKSKKKLLDDLISENNIDAKVKSCLNGDWEKLGPERRRQVLDYAGAGVASVLETIAPNDQSGLLYRNLVQSNYVEKHLTSEVPLSKFAEEIINTANGVSESFDALQQYISTLVEIPGINFRFLNQFNSTPEDHDSDDEDAFEKVKSKRKFTFRFTYHLWISSVKHRRRYGHGNEPIKREKNFKWYDYEVCETVYNYIVSPLNTQRNSFGVFNLKDDSGKISTIGRVIRHQRNSDLVKNVQAHLKGLGMRVPSRSFLFKFIANLPAANHKEMKGVNNIAEDAMRAFSTLDKIVDTFSSDYGLQEHEQNNLKSCLSASKTYLKTKYYDNLSTYSPILSHCIACAVSDPNDDKKFIEECDHVHENITCDRCELIYETIDILKSLLKKYTDENLLSEYSAAVFCKRLKDSLAAIKNYQAHLVKVHTQECEWNRLIEKRDPSVAFMEVDWGMKHLPRRQRQKLSEFFAKNGYSNQIACFIRIIPNSFEIDSITPKDYQKQVDAYVSIVEDDSKQDALTSAAIIKENIIAYKKNHPDVKQLWLRSDCAGCYKCAKLIQAMFSLEVPDLKINGYVFSAPCDGKSICDTYSSIIKFHLSKIVSSGLMDTTSPRNFAKAIEAASGVANVIVMLGKFEFRTDIYFNKIQKITDLSTFIFLENGIKAFKQGRYGEGLDMKMNKIAFPAHYNYEFIGPEMPRRNEKKNLIFRKPGETEIVEGRIDDVDDDIDDEDFLQDPIMQGTIYKCPQENCDAEYQNLDNLQNHLSNNKCFQKRKLRTESIYTHFQRKYIETFGMNSSEKLTDSEKRYKFMSWDTALESISLLPTLKQDDSETSTAFSKGFGVRSICTKNVIHDDVRAFVKEIFDQGETTNKHMQYPNIVQAIEDAKDAYENPRFFPHKWLDVQQVSYLVSRFMKEKGKRTTTLSNEPTQEDISVNLAEENFTRRRDAIQSAIDNMQDHKPLSEQSHPLLLEDGTPVCDIAKDYFDNPTGRESWIMSEPYSEVQPILDAMNIQLEGKNRRMAATEIVNFVKRNCGCIPMRRKRNA